MLRVNDGSRTHQIRGREGRRGRKEGREDRVPETDEDPTRRGTYNDQTVGQVNSHPSSHGGVPPEETGRIHFDEAQ